MPDPRERIRFSARSVFLAVGMFGATLTLLGVLAASRRVIGWILVAAITAGLLHPIVTYLEHRWMRRGLAVLLVMVTLIGAIGTIVYSLVDDLARETRRLEEAAPQRARRLEQSRRWGRLAREFMLEERTRRFVEDVPERLRGGTPAEAIRAAGTRGVAFLATTVLTIFFLLHGPRVARSGAAQISDPDRRQRLRTVATAVYRRGFGYAGAHLTMALAAGLTGYALAHWARVPGAAPLGIWVGLWDLVPGVGAFVGAVPIVALAAVVSGDRAVVLTLGFMAYQFVENRVVERPVERATVRIGPFLTVAAGLVGLELSGVAGALVLNLATVLAVVAADELRPRGGDDSGGPAGSAGSDGKEDDRCTVPDGPPPSGTTEEEPRRE